MRIVVVGSSRTVGASLAAALLFALYAGCTNQSSERRGGGEIPDLTAGAGMVTGNAGASSEAGAGGALGEAGAGGAPVSGPVTWCAAYRVIECSCQRCHQSPPIHQAPFPILSYADTQQPSSAGSNNKVWQQMQTAVKSGYMPFLGLEDPPVDPPVEPLSARDKATLLTWFDEGAHDEGGQACPMVCDWTKSSP